MTNIMTLPLATALKGHTQGENYIHAHFQQMYLGKFQSFVNVFT